MGLSPTPAVGYAAALLDLQCWWPVGATILRAPSARKLLRSCEPAPSSPSLLPTRSCCCRSKRCVFLELKPPATAPACFCCCRLPRGCDYMHSSTVERLYAWKKKLFFDVKGLL